MNILPLNQPAALSDHAADLLRNMNAANHRRIDQLFVVLMGVQWVGGIILALTVAPLTWIGNESEIHLHVWAAIFLGGAISTGPLLMVRLRPGSAATRHTIAVAQALWGALLIHLSGGRIETHFFVFGSLAFMAFYRDWRVLLTMTLVTTFDHAVRGTWWPLSVYGVAMESPYRWIEHSAWVIFEDIGLVFACLRGQQEVRSLCIKQAELQESNIRVERTVKERSQELRQAAAQAEKLALVARCTDNAVVITDADGRIEWVNEGFERLWGYTLEEVHGKVSGPVLEGPATDPETVRYIQDKLKRGEGFNAEVVNYRRSGEPYWMALEVRPVTDETGHVVRLMTIRSDITERKQTEEEVARLSLVAKYTDNAVVITDAQGRIEWVNDGFERLTEYTLDEVKGRVPGHFLHGPETDPATVDLMRTRIRQKRGFDVEIVNYTKSGEPYWLAIEVRPICDPCGEVIRFVAIENNITVRRQNQLERERLHTQLQAAARQAGMAEVATGMLHNVGNILNSVNVSAHLIREAFCSRGFSHLSQMAEVIAEHENDLAGFLTSDARGQHFPELFQLLVSSLSAQRDIGLQETETLRENIEHIKQIVSVQQSMAGTGGVSEIASTNDLMRDALRIHDASLVRHNVNVTCEFDCDLEITVQRHEVLQILINLIRNAKQALDDYRPTDRQMTLRTWRADGFVCMSVEDNGPGIPEENRDRIFQHGFTTKRDGHGYGLHSAANAAQQMGGSLTASSEGIGCGAVFILRLPVCSPPAQSDRDSGGATPELVAHVTESGD